MSQSNFNNKSPISYPSTTPSYVCLQVVQLNFKVVLVVQALLLAAKLQPAVLLIKMVKLEKLVLSRSRAPVFIKQCWSFEHGCYAMLLTYHFMYLTEITCT